MLLTRFPKRVLSQSIYPILQCTVIISLYSLWYIYYFSYEGLLYIFKVNDDIFS